MLEHLEEGKMKLSLSLLLVLISSAAFSETFTLCDGQTVCGRVYWRGKAGVTVNIEGTDVFVEGDKICSPYYRDPCGNCDGYGSCGSCGSSEGGIVFLHA